MQIKYVVMVPKKYKSCKWNGMKVSIIEEDATHAITINGKGKKLRFNKKWLLPV